MKKWKFGYESLYYLPLIFLIFPIGGLFWFSYPWWTLGLTVLFISSYLYLVNFSKGQYVALAWMTCLAYIIVMTFMVNAGMMWFVYYMSNLLTYRYTADKWNSYRFLSYFASLAILVVGGLCYGSDMGSKVMPLIVSVVSLFLMFVFKIEFESERQEAAIREKNRTINLLSAENERNRIGRDLHDTLGHTFAMISLKTELALKKMEQEDYLAVQKQLEELHQISNKSMHDVREIVNNLKYRTIAEELSEAERLFSLSEINFSVNSDVASNQLSPVMQSTVTMILRELSNNIIKHAEATEASLRISRKNANIVLQVTDNGKGFNQLTGEELHSIRERLHLVDGELTIVSTKSPTVIEVSLKEGIES